MNFKIGTRFIIFSSAEPGRRTEESYSGNRIPIILGPGQAFGSGGHETTTSCLEELEGLELHPRAKVLDLGCGTGILAIAAVKLGAQTVTAVDNSPDAVEATVNNLKLNGVKNGVKTILGTLETIASERFDFILANMYGDVLLALVDKLANSLLPGGQALLSGILYESNYDLRTAFDRKGLALVKNRFLEQYTTMVYRK